MTTTVLICDDHPISLRGLADYLSELPGIQVVGTVLTARQIAPTVHHLQPDVLFLDIKMGEDNTIEQIGELKKLRSNLLIVIFTSYNLPTLTLRALELGADAYLLKSCSEADIRAAIQSIQCGNRYIGENVRLRAGHRACLIEKKTAPLDVFEVTQALTKRENEIFALTIEGQTESEIAHRLTISIHTVHTHRKNIMKKLDIHNVADLVRHALNWGKTEKDWDSPTS